MPHQVWVAESDNVEIGFSKSLSVGQKRREQAIAALSGEAVDKDPVKQPLSLVEHLHREIAEAAFDDVLQLSDRDLLDALTLLAVEDFTCEKAPEDLGEQLLV